MQNKCAPSQLTGAFCIERLLRMSRPSRIEVTAVARITITRQWPDQDVLSVSVKAESNYPDALAEAVRTAIHTFAEALDIAVTDVDES